MPKAERIIDLRMKRFSGCQHAASDKSGWCGNPIAAIWKVYPKNSKSGRALILPVCRKHDLLLEHSETEGSHGPLSPPTNPQEEAMSP